MVRVTVCVAIILPLSFLRAVADDDPVIWRGEDQGAGSLAFSPDGKRIAAGAHYKDKSFLWSVETGKQIAELKDSGDLVFSVSFSSDGKQLVTAGLDSEKSQWRVVLWNGQTGKRMAELPANLGWRAEILPGGKSLAVASLAGPIAFFQLPKVLKSGEFKTDANGGVNAMTCSPDGKSIATARDKTVSVWNVKGGKATATLAVAAQVDSLAFSRDSKRLYAGTNEGHLQAWTVGDRRSAWETHPHEAEIRHISVAPDGSFVATASHDNTVCLSDPRTGQEIRRIERAVGSVESVAISPDSKTIAVGHSGGIALWKAQSGSPSIGVKGEPDSKAVFTYKLTKKEWKLEDKPVPLCDQKQGFGILSAFSGNFAGNGEFIQVRVDDKKKWFLHGNGFTGAVAARALVIENLSPKLFSEDHQVFDWLAGEPAVKMIRADEGICYVSLIKGAFAGGGEKVQIEKRDDGFYWLTGQSGQAELGVQATALKWQSNQAKKLRSEEFTWKAGQEPVKLFPRSAGLCFVTSIGGSLAGYGEELSLDVAEDGMWTLSGRSQQDALQIGVLGVRWDDK